MPERVQISRRRGWRMPPNTVKVDRTTSFGNPWTVSGAREAGYVGTDDEIRHLCRDTFARGMALGLMAVEEHLTRINELRGKNLACWCRLDQPCHADVLLDYANRPLCETVTPEVPS